jgi:hypothetical protein
MYEADPVGPWQRRIRARFDIVRPWMALTQRNRRANTAQPSLAAIPSEPASAESQGAQRHGHVAIESTLGPSVARRAPELRELAMSLWRDRQYRFVCALRRHAQRPVSVPPDLHHLRRRPSGLCAYPTRLQGLRPDAGLGQTSHPLYAATVPRGNWTCPASAGTARLGSDRSTKCKLFFYCSRRL